MIGNIKRAIDFNDVLIIPRPTTITSRNDINLEIEDEIPIMAANMATIGQLSVAKILANYKLLTCLHKFYDVNEIEKEALEIYRFLIPSAGIDKESNQRLEEICKHIPGIKYICFDVANGYMIKYINHLFEMRNKYPDVKIIAGNVATPKGCEQILNTGVDYVKIGIGSGSACLTRNKTGIGYSQFMAILECVKEFPGKIISDGGCRTPGDIAKAFAAGSRFVMLGGMLAGHDETGKEFYGMSSRYAQEKFLNQFKNYRASEGRYFEFEETKGPLEKTILDILGGLRSSLSYSNCSNLKEFIETEHDFVFCPYE